MSADPKLPKDIYGKVLETMMMELEQMNDSIEGEESDVPGNVLRAERKFLDTMIGWGTTDFLREYSKLCRLDGATNDVEERFSRRFTQSAAGYLNFPIPTEEMEDVEQTVVMLKALKKAAPGLRLTWGCSTFVPKAHTPFQWFGVNKQGEKRLQFLQKQLRPQGIEFRPESFNWSVIQTLLSRGDRRLGPMLEKVRHYGETLGSYRRAFKDLKGQLPDIDFYVYSDWKQDQVLPWNHLQGPLPVQTLQRHLASAISVPEVCANG